MTNNWISANATIQAGRRRDVTNTVERLRRNAELYHAGHIKHEEFSNRNKNLWHTAEEFGYAEDVKRVLFGR